MANYIYISDRLTLNEILGFIDELDEELIEAFDFVPNPKLDKAQQKTYRLKDHFEAYFYNCVCRYRKNEVEIARKRFMSIVFNNIFIIKQLRKLKEEIIHDLQDWDLYRDETITDQSTNATGNLTIANNLETTMKTERNLIEGQLIGQSDAATMSSLRGKTKKAIESKGLIDKSENKMMDYLDPNSRNVQHTISKFGGSNLDTTSTRGNDNQSHRNNSSTKGSVFVSNPYKDRITYLRQEIPELTSLFLSKFRPMFCNM